MNTQNKLLSATRLNRLREQGFTTQSDRQLTDMAFGIRFAYRACLAILVVAIAACSIPLFSVMLGIAFLGAVLPNHPFDYVYNYTFSKWMNKPQLPHRAAQLRFACSMATVFLSVIIYLVATDQKTAAFVLSIMLSFVALLPSTIDLCLPSRIYNAMFKAKPGKTQSV